MSEQHEIKLYPALNPYLDRMDATQRQIDETPDWSRDRPRLERRYKNQYRAYLRALRRIEAEENRPRQLKLF